MLWELLMQNYIMDQVQRVGIKILFSIKGEVVDVLTFCFC